MWTRITSFFIRRRIKWICLFTYCTFKPLPMQISAMSSWKKIVKHMILNYALYGTLVLCTFKHPPLVKFLIFQLSTNTLKCIREIFFTLQSVPGCWLVAFFKMAFYFSTRKEVITFLLQEYYDLTSLN